METIKELLIPKSFNHVSFVVVICSLIIGIILLARVADIETNEQKYFTCGREGKEEDSLQTTTCFAEYQAKTTRDFPIYGFVLLNFLLVTIVCFFYSQSVQSKVKDLEHQDPEMPTNQFSSRLYRRYCTQLVVRFALGMTFLVLQWGVFYPHSFPSKYACDLSSIHKAKHTNITSNDAVNTTWSSYDCHNPQAGKKTFWNMIVFAVNALLSVLILLELIYVTRKGHMNDNFREDLEFFNIYLQNKDSKVIERYVVRIKKNIEENTKFYEPLLPNIPGEERKLLELDKVYTHLIMYPGRARHEFKGERHEIFEGYFKSQEKHEYINKIEDIFAPESKTPQERPLSIMIVGRPGIGKSLLCLKILRDWACGKYVNDARKCFEFVCLFKFRHFNSDEKISLQQLLGRGHFSGAFPTEVYNWILRYPEKVLLIFDGLDEFGKKENIVKEDEFGSVLAETIPFSALYSKLTFGKLLKGATVVTTSRPTALTYVSCPNKEFDRTLEALGFDSVQIKKYVESFCQGDSDIQQRIWNHISSSANLLSLCYIPVNCHIVCFSLQERLKLTEQDEVNDVDYLPTTLTEIYEDALKIIVCKHNPRYRCSVPEQEELLASQDFAPEVETCLKSLGEIAYKGIEENDLRLIFESNEVKGYEECGLLHRLPDALRVASSSRKKKQYCFLHLTIQELLAARYIVAQLMKGNLKEELQSWISKHLHEGKLEVVLQFISGLLHNHGDHNSIIAIFINSLPLPPINATTIWPPLSQKLLVSRLFKCIFENSRSSKDEWKSVLTTETLSGVDTIDLSELSLTDADLTSIVFVLQEVKSIESLNLSLNNITSIGCLEVQKLLKMTDDIAECKLTTLSISCNHIGEDGIKHLSDALASNKCKLTTLRVSSNRIGDNGMKHLSAALATNECKLTTLDLRSNMISDEGMKHLSSALATNECQLTKLGISSNIISDDGLKNLSDALATNECKLTKLDISRNTISDDGLKNLSDALATNECELKTLDISHTAISDDGLKHLSDALTTNDCKLTKLVISFNKIGAESLKHFSDALTTSECKLSRLNIRGNVIRDDGLKHLSHALATNECKLTKLDLMDCAISDDGLYISQNAIRDDGLKHLSHALATNKCKLTTLRVSSNRIGDNGMKHLSAAITRSECKLTKLDISSNAIRDDGLKHLSDAILATNEWKLTTLNIRDNPIHDDGLKHLSDVLAAKGCILLY